MINASNAIRTCESVADEQLAQTLAVGRNNERVDAFFCRAAPGICKGGVSGESLLQLFLCSKLNA